MNFEGKEVLIAYYKMENGQVVGVNIPSLEVFIKLKTLIYLVVIFIGEVIAILVALYLGRRISKPIGACSKHMDILASGDLTPNISEEYLKRQDEIGALTRSTKSMQEEI